MFVLLLALVGCADCPHDPTVFFDGYCTADGALVVPDAPDVPFVSQCGWEECWTLLPVAVGSQSGGWYIDGDGSLVVNCAANHRITVE